MTLRFFELPSYFSDRWGKTAKNVEGRFRTNNFVKLFHSEFPNSHVKRVKILKKYVVLYTMFIHTLEEKSLF